MLLINRLQKCLSQDNGKTSHPATSGGISSGKNSGIKVKGRRFVGALGSDEQLGIGFGTVTPRISRGKLLVDQMMAYRVVPAAVVANQFNYFLDGIQRSWLLYYQGFVPVYYGYIAAVIRERVDRTLQTWHYAVDEALYLPKHLLDDVELARLEDAEISIVDTDPEQRINLANLQPMELQEIARNAIGNRREKLEAQLAEYWIKEKPANAGWLVVDGSITISPMVASQEKILGIIKSHNTQYFPFPEQDVILNLAAGERSSIFQPPFRSDDHPKVCSCYLRLRSNSANGEILPGQDLYFGLVRLEVAMVEKQQIDEVSCWLLTECRPLSMPDSRWDRMIYPIRDCEQFLRSKEPSRSAFGWFS